MSLYEKLLEHEEFLSVVGLGYVGMPLAHAFAKKGLNVIGFDLNSEKIALYKKGIDPTHEVGHEEIKKTKINLPKIKKTVAFAIFSIYNNICKQDIAINNREISNINI